MPEKYMAKSKRLNTSMRNAEVDTVSDAIVVLYNESGITEDSRLAAIILKISQLSAALTTAIKRDKIVSGLTEADAARDECLRTLATMLEGYAVVPVDAVQTAAKALLQVFNKYGREIAYDRYEDESSYIESLLEDLGADSLSAHINALTGVAETIESLRDAEDVFKAKTKEYVDAGLSVGESATAVKKELVSFINSTLVSYLVASCAVDDSYLNFAEHVYARIDRANAALKADTTSSEHTTTTES
jgi:hypothetical protein